MPGHTLPFGADIAGRITRDWQGLFTAAQRQELAAVVRNAFVDTMACALAGRGEAATLAVLAWKAAQDRPGGQAALFGAMRLEAADAALVDAVAAHALDFDDVGLESHPSVVLVPALRAARRPDQHGFTLVEAYAKGYAVWAELQRRLKVSLHARGWHPTAVFGPVAAAGAVGVLRGLDEQQMAHALGLAASSAGGVVANFGSMAKPLHIGRAAQAGVQSVQMAQAGITASADALDGQAGLLAALAGPGQAELQGPCGERFEWALLQRRPGIKKYPVCYAAHRTVDAVLDLRARHRIAAQDVETVVATISSTTAGVLRQHAPANVAEARFSLEFCAAAALSRGSLGLRDVSDQVLADPLVRSLMARVRTEASAAQAPCPIEPSFALHDRVRIALRDGRILDSGDIRFARGHAQLPLSAEEVQAKLFACVEDNEKSLAQDVLAEIDEALAC